MSTILVVDDSPTDRAIIVETIKRANKGWEIREAETGQDALQSIKKSRPDLVVSDLRMPQMNGLELIDAVAADDPDLPFIIVTAQGSERMAVEALKSGAASYVPKSQLAKNLVETIEQVWERARADQNYQRLISRLVNTEYSFELENDPQFIAPLVDLLQQMAYSMNVVNAIDKRQIGVALDEALLNAMLHGNLELSAEQVVQVRRRLREGKFTTASDLQANENYEKRKVFIRARITPHRAEFFIRDEGMGFYPGAIPSANDPKTMVKDSGRGLTLMKNFMDEVTFNKLGNEVTLVKHRKN